MKVTLKDGSFKEYEQPMSVIDIAASISAGLARMACAGFPGAARSKSANELLRFKPGEDNQYTFSYPGLFADDWQEAEGEEEEDAIFNRDYRAVWFAHQTARDYDKHVKALKPEDPDVLAVINNGKWCADGQQVPHGAREGRRTAA